MSRRLGAWWMAGMVLPLVLGGLIVMHTVDLGSAGPASAGDHASVAGAVAPVEKHGEHDHGCKDCHLGLHITAVCGAVLGVDRGVARRPSPQRRHQARGHRAVHLCASRAATVADPWAATVGRAGRDAVLMGRALI